MFFIDFETYPIKPLRPEYPPAPVGVAIMLDGHAPQYFTGDDMRYQLFTIFTGEEPVCFHNAAFDLEVAYKHLRLPKLPAHRVYDTLIMAFLAAPFQSSLSLKELVQKLLGMTVEDQTEMNEWIWNNRHEIGERFKIPVTRKNLGAFICCVPESMRARYAKQDAVRTRALYQWCDKEIARWDMGAALERERKLQPILMDNMREGLRVDIERLAADCETYTAERDRAADLIRDRLRSPINIESDEELAQALLSAGQLREGDFKKTRTGKLSVNKESLLPSKFADPEIARLIGYHSRLGTCLGTFMIPWRNQAWEWKGKVSTHLHQTRGENGMRSGRIGSSSHNFLNIPKSFDDRDDEYATPHAFDPLPLCRKYLLPDKGEVWLHRDFNGQELRVFGHFENGDLADQYRANPRLDVHSYIQGQVKALVHREIERRKIKVLTFLQLYGGGLNAIQSRLRCTPGEAMEFRRCHNLALRGRVVLSDEIARVLRRGGRIRTWGGRTYPMPPHAPGDDPSYKMLNYLVQGSSADLTKQCLVEWAGMHRPARLLVTVYDEINISAAPRAAAREMGILREVMDADRLKVPMLSDGKFGPTWGDLVAEEDVANAA